MGPLSFYASTSPPGPTGREPERWLDGPKISSIAAGQGDSKPNTEEEWVGMTRMSRRSGVFDRNTVKLLTTNLP